MHNTFFKLLKHHSYFVVGTLVIFVTMFSMQQAQAEDRRIVNIYNDGQKIVLPTKATTVAEAIGIADIEIDERDLVEPALDREIDSGVFNVNIYRARPVTIHDNGRKYSVVTPHQDYNLIAQAAGLELHPLDHISVERIDNFVAENGLGVKMLVSRSVPVNLTLYGTKDATRTHAKTVEKLLVEKGIEFDSNDKITPALETKITDDIDVSIVNVGKKVVKEQEKIEFDTETVVDTSKDADYEKVRTNGKDGQLTKSYEVILHDGKEVERTLLSEQITKQPTKEIIVVGVAPTPTPAPETAVLGSSTASRSVNLSGTKEDWMRAAGIPESEWWAVDYIVTKESGWDPCAYNPAQSDCSANPSSACGLAQSLPCGKQNVYGHWTDPVGNLKWQYEYVNARYGGYGGAYNFWVVNHWY